MSKKIFTLIGLAGVILSSPAFAFQDIPFDPKGLTFPFNNTARGVQDYANKQNWGSSKKVTFTDIGDTRARTTPCGVVTTHIICGGGYVTIVDPLGTRVCELDSFNGLRYFTSSGNFQMSTERCVQR